MPFTLGASGCGSVCNILSEFVASGEALGAGVATFELLFCCAMMGGFMADFKAIATSASC
ncbi:hypothetical protein D3C76_1704390 [compost metagenome]